MLAFDVDKVLHGVLPGGCVQQYIPGFATRLLEVGYALLPTRDYARAASHLGNWMDEREIAPGHLHGCQLTDFSHHVCTCPGVRRRGWNPSTRYIKRVERFVEYLRDLGVAPTEPQPPSPERPELLIAFQEWLQRHRGLSQWTVDRHTRLVAKLLPVLGDDPSLYDAAVVRHAILDEVRNRTPSDAKTFVTALRVYLRFLATQGRCRPNLDRAVPTIPHWRLSSLPRHIEADDIERVIGSCDLNQPHGVRDRAILLLLARLGLRASDIIDMHLDDLDFKESMLKVRGKNRRESRLPLPQDVGEALIDYLVNIRPQAATDSVFLCANAPTRPLPTTTSVSDIVRLALKRAGITNAPSKGSHLLRHSAAVSMLRDGVSVVAISAILRHRSSDMTAYYAKVDTTLLEMVAQPWPEVVSC